MGLFAFIGSLIILTISIFISVLISQPFTGALVRLRANYLPKAVSLDNVLEDGSNGGQSSGVRGVTPRVISGYFLRERQSTAKIGPVVTGILSMMMRTKRLEGWPGVYKGWAPVVCQLIVLGLFTFLFFNVDGLNSAGGGQYRAAPSGPGQFGFWSNLFFMIVTSIVALPLNVITNRAIVHPRVLSFNNPRKSLGELLSYTEYSQPWRIYLTPGLLATELVHITWIGLITRLVRHLAVPSWGGLPPSTPASPGDETYVGPSTTVDVSPLGMGVFLAWCVLSVVVLSPIECVIVRLSVQRPEKQQPLHLAYARLPANASARPASYNNQAQVTQQTTSAAQSNGAQYRDDATGQADAAPSRPSFAITDDDEEERPVGSEDKPKQGEVTQDTSNAALIGGLNGNTEEQPPALPPKQASKTQSEPATSGPPPRVLGIPPSAAPTQTSSPSSNPYASISEQPSEPVIALRPCDEPQTAEEAARAEEEGFGAPTVERYTGMIDCLNKLVDEEGIEALYRGAWVTLLGVLVGNFG